MKPSNILVDLDVCETVIFNKAGKEETGELFGLIEKGVIQGWISALTRARLVSLCETEFGIENARKYVRELTKRFSEVPLRRCISDRALENRGMPYETGVQVESARQFHLDGIISENREKYSQIDGDVYSPEEFLQLFNQEAGERALGVPFLDLKAQHHSVYNDIDDRLTDIITNTAFILGKYVEEFETGFARMQDAGYCIGVSSGTDALHVALAACDIGPGDRVIVPANTFIATAEAVSLTGAVPVFVDCNSYYNIDVEGVASLLKDMAPEQRERIKAIIPVHLYGQPADMTGIRLLAQQYGIRVVEDCCQAHLAALGGKKVGTFGEFGAFSFYPGKNLGAYGEAGALITNDEALFQKAKMIRQHGEIQRYQHRVIGHNYRMSAFQGAVLGVKMKVLEDWTKRRRENAKVYNDLLGGVKNIKIPRELKGTSCVYHLYVIQVDDRDGLQQYLLKNGVATGLHYPTLLHLQEAYRHLGYTRGEFPVAEKAAQRIVSLPMYPELTREQIAYVCEKIVEYVNN